MAYRKRSTSRRTYSRSYGSGRGYSRTRTTTRRRTSRKSYSPRVSTVRIVVEQPQAVSSVGGVVNPNVKAPRKAQF